MNRCVHFFDSGTMAKGLSGINPAVALDRVHGIEVAELNPKVAIVLPRLFGGQRPMRQTPKYWRNTVGECLSYHILRSCEELYLLHVVGAVVCRVYHQNELATHDPWFIKLRLSRL
jgi:hypothetical protein